ncbi:hypothetical protein [Paludisphaera soli]|uniref:hypothetical protein n=1 Tax=Paludisphaera soli TaxID=2712865 RepID=UPI0013EB52C6|nr:hypothetical protein [Paludisphaera soli]
MPGYDPGAPGGRVIPAQPGSYPVRNRGDWGWGRGRGRSGFGPGRYAAPVARRYQIPGGYYGTPAGYLINYGGARYITHADGTMSPY